MKLRNKKTGEIVEFEDITRVYKFIGNQNTYNSLAELNEEWEDYKEPNIYYFIDIHGEIKQMEYHKFNWQDDMKQIGNYFETKEEAEKAVEKLKAWKRLRDKGFRLDAVVDTFFCLDIYMKGESYEAIKDDLNIVFGGNDESNK